METTGPLPIENSKYFEGKPCKRGHTLRYVSVGKCVECWRMRCEENKESNRLYSRKYREENKESVREANRNRREENGDAIREAERISHKKRRMTPTGRARGLIKSARERAKKAGLPFAITVEDILPAMEAGFCAATGIRFEMGPPPAGFNQHPLAPSLDQIVAGKGYTPDNVRLVTWQFNLMAGQLPDEELVRFCRAFLRQRGFTIT